MGFFCCLLTKCFFSMHGWDHTHLWSVLHFDVNNTSVKFCDWILHSWLNQCRCKLSQLSQLWWLSRLVQRKHGLSLHLTYVSTSCKSVDLGAALSDDMNPTFAQNSSRSQAAALITVWRSVPWSTAQVNKVAFGDFLTPGHIMHE